MLRYSIIVCTYNRASFLKETLESILSRFSGQTNFELLVIDNNSTDETAAVVKAFAHVPVVRYVLETQQGLSFARNRGIQEARYPILVFVDDDIDIDPRYLAVLDRVYADPNVSIVGGRVLPYQATIPDWLPSKYHYLASVFDMGDEPRQVLKLLGANHTFRKEVAERVGGYNVTIGPIGNAKLGGDENEFLMRAHQQGFQPFYHPDLIVHHKIGNRLNKEFILQYAYNIGMTEANIDYVHSKVRITVKSLVYLAGLTANRFRPTPSKDYPFVRDIRREHKRGYLNRVQSAITGAAPKVAG